MRPIRTYTLLEAQQKLNEILPTCLKLKELVRGMEEKAREWQEEKKGPFADLGLTDQPVEEHYFRSQLSALSILWNLQREGIILRRLEPILLDFPHRRSDEVVFLCWEEGEQNIQYWHETDRGFSGRKRLDQEEDPQSFA